MAIQHLPVVHFPPPSPEQAAALRATCEYLNQVGTKTASVLLGCPPLDRNASTLAGFSNQLLQCAALCEGLLELIDR